MKNRKWTPVILAMVLMSMSVKTTAQNSLTEDVIFYNPFSSGGELFIYKNTNTLADAVVTGDFEVRGNLSFGETTNLTWPGQNKSGAPKRATVEMIKDSYALNFKVGASGRTTQTIMSLTDQAALDPTLPDFIGDIGIVSHKTFYSPAMLVNGYIKIGNINPTVDNRIDNAALQVDGRVYISEEGGTEEGWDDTSDTNYQDFLLWVEEGVVSKDFAIAETTDWPDYVFNEAYVLPTLEEVEDHIIQNGFLHTMPSAKQVETSGFTVSDLTKRTVRTIEELTLHTIAQEKKITAQESLIKELMTRLEVLEEGQ